MTLSLIQVLQQWRECIANMRNLVSYRLIFTLKQRTIPAAAYVEAKKFFNMLAIEDSSHLLLNTANGQRFTN